MKKTISLLLLMCSLFCGYSGFAQNPHYYYYKNNKIYLQESPNRILVRFSSGLTYKDKSSLLNHPLLQPINQDTTDSYFDLAFATLTPGASISERDEVLAKLLEEDRILSANPLYNNTKESFLGVMDEFLVRLKPESSYADLEELAEQTGSTILGASSFSQEVFRVRAGKVAQNNALATAVTFYETGKFVSSSPDFIMKAILGNPYQIKQWALYNDGINRTVNNTNNIATAGMDMKVLDAWALTANTPAKHQGKDVIVAVIDDGVDLNHPDLTGAFVPGYDFAIQAWGPPASGAPGSMWCTNYPTGIHCEPHGTTCAGVIAARDNNIGLIGVAPQSKIMPIRLLSQHALVQESHIANALKTAINNGASIISCSWGLRYGSNSIAGVIQNDAKCGRGGLGTLMFFNMGNQNSDTYPDFINWLNNQGTFSPTPFFPTNLPEVIAVGAMSMCGERKYPNSCDNQSWGSNYGEFVDIVAPGTGITTTDVSGPGGYSENGVLGGYTQDYHEGTGTSMATPLAAGVMALILAAQPNLQDVDARAILEKTCTKIQPDPRTQTAQYNYVNTAGHPSGTWNNQTGYGGVNAHSALQLAISLGQVPIKIYNCYNPGSRLASPAFSAKTVSATVYPNPFNKSATIEYNLKEEASVSIMVYDAFGRVVSVLEQGSIRNAGMHTVLFNGEKLASGIYFYSVETNGQRITNKLVLLK